MRRPEGLFEVGSNRLAYILRVMQTARDIEARRPYGGLLVTAAAYHDIGYAKPLILNGYHPIHGALVARNDTLDTEIVDAVLHHSGARGAGAAQPPRSDGALRAGVPNGAHSSQPCPDLL